MSRTDKTARESRHALSEKPAYTKHGRNRGNLRKKQDSHDRKVRHIGKGETHKIATNTRRLNEVSSFELDPNDGPIRESVRHSALGVA